MRELFWVSSHSNPRDPTRKEKKFKKSNSLESVWYDFIAITAYGIGNPNLAIYSTVKGLERPLAYSLVRKGFPEGDEFDRMRIRVTTNMPLKFRARIIDEMKSGIRHLRDF